MPLGIIKVVSLDCIYTLTIYKNTLVHVGCFTSDHGRYSSFIMFMYVRIDGRCIIGDPRGEHIVITEKTAIELFVQRSYVLNTEGSGT